VSEGVSFSYQPTNSDTKSMNTIAPPMLAALLATAAGTAAGYFYYPWAYPTASGHFAFIVLGIIEAIGYIFCVKVMEEGSNKNSNGIVGASIGGAVVFILFVSLFVGW